MITLGKEFTKFLVVGVFSTAINYGVFYVLFKFAGVFYLISSVLGFLCGVFAGYKINTKWTFSILKTTKSHFMKYLVVYCISLIVGVLFLKFLVEVLQFMPEFANFLMICLTTITNFVGVKFFALKNE